MKIKKIVDQHRRDFTAVFECEHCSDEVTMTGYDDDNFHMNVIPNFICKKCGQKSPKDSRPLTPKYTAGQIV